MINHPRRKTMRATTAIVLALLGLPGALSGQTGRYQLELRSDRIGLFGVPLAESATPVQSIGFSADIDKMGEGSGVLALYFGELLTYDEFGFASKMPGPMPVKLECNLKFVKKTFAKGWPYRLMEGPGEPLNPKEQAKEYEWRLYSITGPKVTSRLFLAVPIGDWSWTEARLLAHGENGKVKYVVDLEAPRRKP
jgi:hypothetical protein